ncbi:14807_t:CDS:2, partial [Acaulospora colombiana]
MKSLYSLESYCLRFHTEPLDIKQAYRKKAGPANDCTDPKRKASQLGVSINKWIGEWAYSNQLDVMKRLFMPTGTINDTSCERANQWKQREGMRLGRNAASSYTSISNFYKCKDIGHKQMTKHQTLYPQEEVKSD